MQRIEHGDVGQGQLLPDKVLPVARGLGWSEALRKHREFAETLARFPASSIAPRNATLARGPLRDAPDRPEPRCRPSVAVPLPATLWSATPSPTVVASLRPFFNFSPC